MERRNEITDYLENISLGLLGILLFAFPLVITSATTEPYTLPKQILLGGVTLILLLFTGARMISDGAVRLRRTPFDLPILLFTAFLLLSSLFSVNRYDSLIAYTPFLFSVLAYFLIVNVIKTPSTLFFLVASLVAGASITSILTVLSFFKIYLLPFAFTKTQIFSPLGSLLDQAMYLVIVLPAAIFIAKPVLEQLFGAVSGKSDLDTSSFSSEAGIKGLSLSVVSLLILTGIGVTLYELLILKPAGGLTILPFEVGFQTAFAAISQDAGRIAQGFFLGSGFGTYMNDFTRFKQAVPFNLNQTLWSLTFLRSSSFVLELLATTGILGLTSFGFLLFKIIQGIRGKYTRENPIFFSVLFTIIVMFFLPFSPVMQALFFFILAIYAGAQGLHQHREFFDVEVHFVAFRKGIMPLVASPVMTAENESASRMEDKSFTKALPVSSFIIFLIISSTLGFFSYRYVASDILFQNSLVAAAANDGLKTYNDETNAINLFPYRDAYYRIYSQTNLAIANSLAAQQPKDASPSAQAQQTIYTLIQQSINSGRNATIISPLTSLNWQNLASLYRALIGFGRDAENFAIASAQRAIVLDPNNPQQYLNFGGIYYQLGQWDLAQRQFQIAINLKPDFANAYYNLGHALESKGDLQNALVVYQTVRTLVVNEPVDLKKITDEITVLQSKIGSTQAKEGTAVAPAENQPPLNVNTSSQQLPERKPPVQIPPPATQSAR